MQSSHPYTHFTSTQKRKRRTDEVVVVPVEVPLLPKGLLRDPEGDPVPEELLPLWVSIDECWAGCGRGITPHTHVIPIPIPQPQHNTNKLTWPWIRNLSVAVIWSTPKGLCDHSAPFLLCRSGVSLYRVGWGYA